ncbi:MAG: ErfK/YbiS/YcfS/YnhG family protein [Deltaproteobacteria bacterium]|nr:ErfK/YbiS/YcfS/YnhG family protein [Deltaproteobacteria bacterium]
MLRNVVAGAVVAALVSTLAACALLRLPPPVRDPTLLASPTPSPSPTPAFAWANGSEYAVVIRKEERTLTVYHRSEQVKVYPIVLGIASYGPKVYQGDLRTPEGVYRISSKRPHARWSRFMLLSYPNDQDRDRYAMALTEGRVPIIDGHAPGIGGAVGIHGSDREDSNARGDDWTWGCISLLNQHVAELYDTIPIDTPVLILR